MGEPDFTFSDYEQYDTETSERECPYCDGIGGRTCERGFINCEECDGTGRLNKERDSDE